MIYKQNFLFPFIAVPFFIMMAQVMCDGDITKKLMAFCNIFIGRVRGGTALFIGCSIAKRPIEEMVKGFMPFYGAMVILLLPLTFIPEITLCLPRFLGLL